MSIKTEKELSPLTAADYHGDIETLDALIKKYEPHFAQGAHLITAVGALRTTVATIENHIAAIAAKAEKAAE